MKVGIIGTGGMGGVHARAYAKMDDVELFGYDRNEERLSQVIADKGAHRSTIEELIAAVDVVDVCLPTDLHADAVIQAIDAGKAVMCEKPLTRDIESARRLVDKVRQSGARVGVGQVVRFFPEFRRAHELVKSGAVGKPAAIRTHRGGGAPSGDGGWFMDHSRSGGVLVDLAIHDFDWLRWTFGEVTSVYARSVAAHTMSGPDYGLTTMSHEGGAISHVEATWMDPSGFWTAIEIAGSDGLLAYDSRRTASLTMAVAGRTSYEANLNPTDDPYYLELRAFIDAMVAGAPVPVGIEEGFHAVAIALAALESAQTGKPVTPARL